MQNAIAVVMWTEQYSRQCLNPWSGSCSGVQQTKHVEPGHQMGIAISESSSSALHLAMHRFFMFGASLSVSACWEADELPTKRKQTEVTEFGMGSHLLSRSIGSRHWTGTIGWGDGRSASGRVRTSHRAFAGSGRGSWITCRRCSPSVSCAWRSERSSARCASPL